MNMKGLEIMMLELKCSASTNIGSRDNNQDAFFVGINSNNENDDCNGVCTTQEMKLFAVFDGVGGFPNSECASDFGVRYLRNELKKYDDDIPFDEWIIDIAEDLHRSMKKFLLNSLLLGGTTLTLLAIKGNEYCLLNVGDSPAYLISDGSINQLSKTQTFAEYKLSRNIEPYPEDYHTLMFCVGFSYESMNEIAYMTKGILKKDDKMILCTDGVSNYFSQQELLEMAEKGEEAEFFVSTAARSEDSDNCTAIVINVINQIN